MYACEGEVVVIFKSKTPINLRNVFSFLIDAIFILFLLYFVFTSKHQTNIINSFIADQQQTIDDLTKDFWVIEKDQPKDI